MRSRTRFSTTCSTRRGIASTPRASWSTRKRPLWVERLEVYFAPDDLLQRLGVELMLVLQHARRQGVGGIAFNDRDPALRDYRPPVVPFVDQVYGHAGDFFARRQHNLVHFATVQ